MVISLCMSLSMQLLETCSIEGVQHSAVRSCYAAQVAMQYMYVSTCKACSRAPKREGAPAVIEGAQCQTGCLSKASLEGSKCDAQQLPGHMAPICNSQV